MDLAASGRSKCPNVGGAPADAGRGLVYPPSKYLVSFCFVSVRADRGEKVNKKTESRGCWSTRETNTKANNIVFC